MKKSLFFALVLALTLLSACGPKGSGSQSAPGLPDRPPVAGDLPPDGSGPSSGPDAGSSAGPAPADPAPALEVLTKWRSDYRYDTQYLRQSLAQLAQNFDMISYTRWPDGHELVEAGSETGDYGVCSLLFSGPAARKESVCAAVALDLHQPATVDQLLAEFGPSLTFRPDDPVAGPSWTVTDSNLTYRFRTDPADLTGQTLLPGGQGGNLVLSMDELLPESPSEDWIAFAESWVDLWTIQPEGPMAALLPYAQVLGTSSAPPEATEPANQEYLDLCYSGYGVKDPDTGVQYISFEGGENTLWDAVIVPASLVFGGGLPQDSNELMSDLNTPFRWSVYDLVGYWFYLDQFSVYLPSDHSGAVPDGGYFLIRLGDNAG